LHLDAYQLCDRQCGSCIKGVYAIDVGIVFF